MLALLVGLLAAAGLLLRGGWDVWAQSLLFLAAAAGTAAWVIARVVVGYVPIPPPKLALWAVALAALAGLSAFTSPLSAYAIESWRVLLLGAWIFCAVAVISKDDRARIDQAVRAAGWFLVLLAFYQHYHDGMPRPASALLNQNVFAGTILMLLPLAVEQRDWFLCAGLAVCFVWAHSVGAWLGLASALVLTRRGKETVGNYAGMAVLFICLVLIYGKLQSPDVLNRVHWWAAAGRMALRRPLLGFGPGAYAYASPSYVTGGPTISTLFAHQHFLETAAECGWPYLLVWAGGLAYFLRRGAPHKRFGAVAVLVQALWDYPLSIAGNFWLFCYFAASTTPQTSLGVNVRSERKAAWAALVLALGLGGCWWAARAWEADRLKGLAIDGFKEGRPAEESLALLERSLQLAADPEAERFAAEMLLAAKPAPSEAQARGAAAHLERAARLNPYRPSTWTALERLYKALGDEGAARRLRAEGERYCPVLRGAPEA